MRIVVIVVLAACGAPPAVAPVAQNRGSAGEPARRFRHVTAGKRLSQAKRTTFLLAGDGDRATLTEIEERAPRARSLAETDHAQWVVRSQRAYQGTRRIDGTGFDLALSAADMQPLNLRCVTSTVEVAAAGAQRVPSPTRGPDGECDRGVWDPPATLPVQAVICGAAGQPAQADDDADHHAEHADHEDRLIFAPGPGIEWAFQNDDCALRGGGLRWIAR